MVVAVFHTVGDSNSGGAAATGATADVSGGAVASAGGSGCALGGVFGAGCGTAGCNGSLRLW